MARPIWSGSISFRPVDISGRLHSAVREQRVAFHLLNKEDHARLQRKLICEIEGKEVHPEHIVRGYPAGPDKYVIVNDAELEALAPKESRTIEITDFVDEDSIETLF